MIFSSHPSLLSLSLSGCSFLLSVHSLYIYLNNQPGHRRGHPEITFQEFLPLMQELGVSMQQAQQFWYMTDVDKSGTLSQQEFLTFCNNPQVVNYIRQLEQKYAANIQVPQGGMGGMQMGGMQGGMGGMQQQQQGMMANNQVRKHRFDFFFPSCACSCPFHPFYLNFLLFSPQRGMGMGQQQGMGMGQQQGMGMGQQRGMGMGQQQGMGMGQQQGMGMGQQRGMGMGQQRGVGMGQQQGMGMGQQRGVGMGQPVSLLSAFLFLSSHSR